MYNNDAFEIKTLYNFIPFISNYIYRKLKYRKAQGFKGNLVKLVYCISTLLKEIIVWEN